MLAVRMTNVPWIWMKERLQLIHLHQFLGQRRQAQKDSAKHIHHTKGLTKGLTGCMNGE